MSYRLSELSRSNEKVRAIYRRRMAVKAKKKKRLLISWGFKTKTRQFDIQYSK